MNLQEANNLVNNAYSDFLDVCNRVAADSEETGPCTEIAFERAKAYCDLLLEAQAIVTREEERNRIVNAFKEGDLHIVQSLTPPQNEH